MEMIQNFLSSLGPFFLLLGLLIFIHELGHFSVARFFGVRVEIFSIGFGKTIFKKKWGDTEYRLSLFPLGGYVKMFGDNPRAVVAPEEEQYSFIHQPVFPRIAVVLAGPLMNLILAFFIFFCIGLYGEPQTAPILGDIQSETTAYQAGLRSGDTIKSINTQNVTSFDHAMELISDSKTDVTVNVLRDNKPVTLQVPTALKTNPNILSSRSEIPQIDGFTLISSSSHIGIDSQSSPLYIAGLRSLDQITKINSVKVETFRDLKNILNSFEAGQTLNIKAKRQGSKSKPEIINVDVITSSLLGLEPTDKYIGEVQKNSPAQKAGFQRGDKILSINGNSVNKWEDIVETIKAEGLKESGLTISVLRDYKEIVIKVQPQIKAIMNERGQEIKRPIVGIMPGIYIHTPDQVFVPAGGVLASVAYSGQETWKWIVWTINSIKKVIFGEVSHKNLGGFITIGQVAKDSFNVGWSYFVLMMGIISINLFLLNLLPIPVLDGGHLVFYIIEAVRGKPVSPQKMEIAFMFGFALLMSLVGLTLFNDIQRVFFSGW